MVENETETSREVGATERPDLAAEMRALGQNLGRAFRAAAESEVAKGFQEELTDGLRELKAQVDTLLKEVSEGEFREKLEKQVESSRLDEFISDIASGLASALKELNRAISKAVDEAERKRAERKGE
ncbi:MAG: hypothetical protein ACUVX8_19075 [Candidatus Zipacnadales bacterium]